MSDKKQIYGFNNGGSPGWMQAIAICEDGHILAEHICSNEGFMFHDLGIEHSKWKHDQYDKHCGPGNWEISWVPRDQIEGHEKLPRAFELNKALPPPPEEVRAGVTVTFSDADGVERTQRVGA